MTQGIKATPPQRIAEGFTASFGLLALVAMVSAAAAPAYGRTPLPSGHPVAVPTHPSVPSARMDVNSATKAQLMTLWGIGEAEASRIIAARPYFSKADIVAKAGIPAGVYLSIKRQIIAVQKNPPHPKG